MFKSIPFTPRKVEATEARLQAIYDAAALGLKGDSLALAAGMLPTEFRQLCELDPAADMAMLKGRADSPRSRPARTCGHHEQDQHHAGAATGAGTRLGWAHH
jgi:hypothetical protein